MTTFHHVHFPACTISTIYIPMHGYKEMYFQQPALFLSIYFNMTMKVSIPPFADNILYRTFVTWELTNPISTLLLDWICFLWNKKSTISIDAKAVLSTFEPQYLCMLLNNEIVWQYCARVPTHYLNHIKISILVSHYLIQLRDNR